MIKSDLFLKIIRNLNNDDFKQFIIDNSFDSNEEQILLNEILIKKDSSLIYCYGRKFDNNIEILQNAIVKGNDSKYIKDFYFDISKSDKKMLLEKLIEIGDIDCLINFYNKGFGSVSKEVLDIVSSFVYNNASANQLCVFSNANGVCKIKFLKKAYMKDKNNSKVIGMINYEKDKFDDVVLDDALKIGLIKYITINDVFFDKVLKIMLSNINKYSIALEVYYDYLITSKSVSDDDLLLDNLYFGLMKKNTVVKKRRR